MNAKQLAALAALSALCCVRAAAQPCPGDACPELIDACSLLGLLGLGCDVDGTCARAGSTQPGNPCRVCDPLRNAHGWSNAPVDLPCDDGLFCSAEDRCDASGTCRGRRARCVDDDIACAATVCDEALDVCKTDLKWGCLITGACIDVGAASSSNGCLVCTPATSTDRYTYQADAASCDSDGDGVRDSEELQRSGAELDTDADGLPNRRDPDDDDDSLPTLQEGADNDGDGAPNDALDHDRDGRPDYLDADDDGDGRSTRQEIVDARTYGKDIDGDGQPNWLDVDSDGDGSTDLAENLGSGDTDKNKIPDYVERRARPVDSDGDGLSDAQECVTAVGSCADTDGDGLADKTDSDDDDDRVLTRHELHAGGPFDTDGDGLADHLDADDDDDRLPTREESADPNGDGDPSDALDRDRDGTPDYLDADDDGDGIPTATELGDSILYGADIDADGTSNWYDADADGDGAPDGSEEQGAAPVLDGGLPPYLDRRAVDAAATDGGGVGVVDQTDHTERSGCSTASGRGDGAGNALWWLALAAWLTGRRTGIRFSARARRALGD